MCWHLVMCGRGNWQMEWVASTLHTTSEHGDSSITTADAHTSSASSRLNWHPADLNGLVRFTKRQNLVSAFVPSHFNWPLHQLVQNSQNHTLIHKWVLWHVCLFNYIYYCYTLKLILIESIYFWNICWYFAIVMTCLKFLYWMSISRADYLLTCLMCLQNLVDLLRIIA